MKRPALLSLALPLLLAVSLAHAQTPWSGSFTYTARGSNASAGGYANHNTANAYAQSSVTSAGQFAYSIGAARASNGMSAHAESQSGIPTTADRQRVLYGQIKLELNHIEARIANLERRAAVSYQPVPQTAYAQPAHAYVQVGWNQYGGPHLELRRIR